MEIMTGQRYCDSDTAFIGQNGVTLTGRPCFFVYGIAYGERDKTITITAGKSPVYVGGRQSVPYFDFTGQTKPGIIEPGQTKVVTYKPGFNTWHMSDPD